MTNPRSRFKLPRDSGWIKGKKHWAGTGRCWVPHVLLFLAVLETGFAAWEEGDDAVNVISVENMDALLGLRMVTELKSFEGVKTNESENKFEDGENVTETRETSEPRYKRMVHSKWKSFSISSQVSELCSTDRCQCTANHRSEPINVLCNFQNDEIILEPGSIPSTVQEVHFTNAKYLTVSPGTFSNHHMLQKATFRDLGSLLIAESAFQHLSATYYFNMTIENCKRVTLEEHSFRNLQNPMAVTVSDCDVVTLKKSIFYWFSHVQIRNVPKLNLVENTFSSEIKPDVEWSGALMLFENVTLNEIPNTTFPLSSAKIVFSNCTIKVIRSGAFNGIALVSVSFQSSRLKRIQSRAFSERTLVQNLEFEDVDIHHVDSNAISAAARFTIQNCRVEEMTSGAFNVSTAYLKLLNNYFLKIRRYAFEIHNWNSIILEGNHFNEIEPEFFTAPFSNVTSVTTEFTFVNNTLARVEVDVLSFVPNEPGLSSLVDSNIFENVCHCHLKTWIRERTGDAWESFYDTSYCVISDLLEKCYNISKGYMNMKKYEERYCASENVLICDDTHKTHRPNILIPLDLHNTERTVLGVIFLGILCSVIIMLTILILMWVRSKGFCANKRKSQTPNSDCFTLCCSHLCSDGTLVTSDSISRMNIHEYAEIQNQINHRQKQTNLTIEEDLEDDEDLIECENKATQTIPEELTQELLQSLREKLDDPENYNEARDMIEHLYDLIKVEESCNNNNPTPRNSFFVDEEETGGIYEVISTKGPATTLKSLKTRRKNTDIDVKSTGTRAPSPDKLLPIKFVKPLPTVVSDYIEPKDRKSNEYCELPSANLIMPDVLTSSQVKNESTLSKSMHIYAEPLQTITSMSQRPLPSKPADPGPSKP